MKVSVIIPAAGAGQRFASSDSGSNDISKVEALLDGRPVFVRSFELFQGRKDVGQIVVAVHPDRLEPFKFKYGDRLGFAGVRVVAGGRAERWESVLKALDAVDPSCTHVAVHDAVRPLASDALIDRVFAAAEHLAAVIPGIAVSATLKRLSEGGRADDEPGASDPMDAILGSAGRTQIDSQRVGRTIDRSGLVEAQTPQVFEADLLRRAYAQVRDAPPGDVAVTDDAGLVEALGETVHVVKGEVMNLKITRADDLKMAESLLAATGRERAADMARKRLFPDEEEE